MRLSQPRVIPVGPRPIDNRIVVSSSRMSVDDQDSLFIGGVGLVVLTAIGLAIANYTGLPRHQGQAEVLSRTSVPAHESTEPMIDAAGHYVKDSMGFHVMKEVFVPASYELTVRMVDGQFKGGEDTLNVDANIYNQTSVKTRVNVDYIRTRFTHNLSISEIKGVVPGVTLDPAVGNRLAARRADATQEAHVAQTRHMGFPEP